MCLCPAAHVCELKTGTCHLACLQISVQNVHPQTTHKLKSTRKTQNCMLHRFLNVNWKPFMIFAFQNYTVFLLNTFAKGNSHYIFISFFFSFIFLKEKWKTVFFLLYFRGLCELLSLSLVCGVARILSVIQRTNWKKNIQSSQLQSFVFFSFISS